MTPILLLYLGIGAAAVIIAGFALVSMLQRRDVIHRATEEFGVGRTAALVLRPDKARESRIRARLEQMAKEQQANEEIQSKLVQAGFDSPAAPAVFVLSRLVSFFVVPLIAFIAIPQSRFLLFAMSMVVAIFLAFVLPIALLDRFARMRQERITKSVPDALDLLVVCVEAGISLDAGILRVAKELRLVHPDLSHELLVVNRVTNAGIAREEALRGLWQRTGVVDLRTLVSSMIQSEKWGTSIATVLRVAAETLRRKRRQAAERRAKMAALKMTFPLLLFILPALFVVILGPAAVQIIEEFGKI
jgi:tight adherence protein C